MANHTLGDTAIQEIRTVMTGLTGTDAQQMAARLASIHKCSWQHIYKITKDLRPARQARADKGKRAFQLVEGSDLWYAAQLVVIDKLDPDQALLTAAVRGFNHLPTLETFQRILRENGLGKKQRKSSKRPGRAWEAEYPGEIFQIDVTALKVRWEDEKTRRILRIEGVDKNHPDPGDNKIRVWQIMAVDDFPRRRFLRYIATTKVTSYDMVLFLCELFTKWGIPLGLYTDNGGEFKRRCIIAEQILNAILAHDGGYKHDRHAPNNSQASGKVEVAHKWAEKMDKYVGLAIREGQKVTIDDLNPFADNICAAYNNRVHRTTGEKPDVRYHSKRIVVRKLPEEIIQSALLSDKFDAVLDPAMTVERDGIKYAVPGQQPFVNYLTQTVSVVIPPNIDLMLIKLPGDEDFREIPKIIATADLAGDFKSHAETQTQQLTKRLKATREAEIKQIKEQSRQTGMIAPVPHLNVRIEEPASNVAVFPHQERIISAEEIAAVTPIAPSIYAAKEFSKWEAIVQFADRFADIDEAKEFFTDLFGDGEIIAETEIEQAIENRLYQQPTRIYAVK